MNKEYNAQLKERLGALLCASEKPLDRATLMELLDCDSESLEKSCDDIAKTFASVGLELVQVGSGLRVQTRAEYAQLVSNLWKEASPRFTKATLETLALIAYRQPITRGEIEHIRGVSVSSNIIRTLLDRKWIRKIGERDVPGKPALYGTTTSFLDYFQLRSLAQLPSLPDIQSLEDIDKMVDQALISNT